jgi:CYTH domain-containing protein
MSVKNEIENKYLVKFPTSWSELSEIFEDLIDVRRISQTYLTAEPNQQAARVRKTITGLVGETDVEYHFNQKRPIDSGVHEEKEYKITKEQYNKHLKNADHKKVEVQKTRFVFKYNDQVFELDVFKGPLKGLAILEIELEDKGDNVDIPPFLEVIKEVTDDKTFSNYELATKNRAKNPLLNMLDSK